MYGHWAVRLGGALVALTLACARTAGLELSVADRPLDLTGWAMIRQGVPVNQSTPDDRNLQQLWLRSKYSPVEPVTLDATVNLQNGGPTTERTKARHLQLPLRLPERLAVGDVRGGVRQRRARRLGGARRHPEVRLGQARPRAAGRRAEHRALQRSVPARRGRAQDRRAGGAGLVLPAAQRLDAGGGAPDRGVDPAVLPVLVSAAGRALVPAGRDAALVASRCRR